MNVHRHPLLTPPSPLNSTRWAGMRVGLLGGSFNPPHKGHVHISLLAMKTLKLDAVWWLIAPYNPFKDKDEYADFDDRLAQCEAMAAHPKIIPSTLQQDANLIRSYDTMKHINASFPETEFVWIMGMDNALILHKWHKWRAFQAEVATMMICRAPVTSLVQSCQAKVSHPHHMQKIITKPEPYPLTRNFQYWMLDAPLCNISSTELRAGKDLPD